MLEPVVEKMLRSPVGTVEAPAGTGKTEQIARMAGMLPGSWLILTHTVAGADVIRRRLRKREIPDNKAQVDTLSAWSHRWARAYPLGSGLSPSWSAKDRDWRAVITAATNLVESGAVLSVLRASFDGVLVDEYQDCTVAHHRLVQALSTVMRCYVFGDPLQAIFGFRDDPLADWESAVLGTFPLAGMLQTGYRWNAAKNPALGQWLIAERENFRAGRFDLSRAPQCINWVKPSGTPGFQGLAKDCSIRDFVDGQTMVVLHSCRSEIARAELAKAMRAATVEPIGGKTERTFYDAMRTKAGLERVDAVLELAKTGLAGASIAEKRKRVVTLLNNPRRMTVPPSSAELALHSVSLDDSLTSVLDALSCIEHEAGVTVVRPDLMYCVKAALRLCAEKTEMELDDASLHVANARREKGRLLRNRSVGSTLLVKGLEFDHVVITPDACTSRHHWYVALTRATRSVKVISQTRKFEL